MYNIEKLKGFKIRKGQIPLLPYSSLDQYVNETGRIWLTVSINIQV